jgi:4'-phosphopantetheinyl transferase
LGISNQNICIEVNKYGKPYVVGLYDVDFNISHSGEYVILGISYGKKIGIDIERIDNNIDLSIGTAVFNHNELLQLNSVYDFYLLWVKKEAYLKCFGEGFATDTYQKTILSIESIQYTQDCDIYVDRFNQNYMLAVCVTK